jgi:peptide/nickel transport system permease protein
MLLLFLSLYVGWLPEFGYFPIWEDPSRNLQALVFPALIVGYRYSAISARMTRSAMLEVLREDYVRTARAKGLPERTVVMRHGLRNALIPVITIMGSQLSHLLGGLVVVEVIFALPGMGRLALDAVVDRDYTVLQGTVLVISTIFVVMNLIVDLSYAVIDPRIRYT